MSSYFYRARSHDPHVTLAAEEYILDRLCPGDVVLYLYSHERAVIIGRNQNAWSEVRTAQLFSEGGKLARRISGGGAVYHDSRNLNFSFIASPGSYDLSRQTEVLLSAVKSFGIDAVLSGRNDLLAEGRKFSGNAFCHRKTGSFHHGTILIDTDTAAMSRYLSPPADKIAAKGIASVRSRVINLSELCPSLCVDMMADALLSAFSERYGSPEPYAFPKEAQGELDGLIARNASEEWIFGRSPACDVSITGRFAWGGVELALGVREGHIVSVCVFSDSLLTGFCDKLQKALLNCPFSSREMAAVISGIAAEDEEGRIFSDICALLYGGGY